MNPMLAAQSTDAVGNSVNFLWFSILQYVPSIFAAIIIFVLGWVIGVVLCRFIVEIAKTLRIDNVMRAAGLTEAAREAGFNLDVGMFLGVFVKWFVMLAFLAASLDVLGLVRVTIFLEQFILLYMPQIIVASLILILAAVLADFVKNLIAHSARAAGAHHGANLAGNVAKWAIWIFAILAALNQLGVASAFVQTLFTGIVIATSLAFGLAFGLGGKDAAARTIDRIRSEISRNQD